MLIQGEQVVPFARILSAILLLLAFVMGLRHGWSLLRSTPTQLEATLHLSLSQSTTLLIGALTCIGAVLVIFPQTFFAANVLSGAVILYLAAAQSHSRNIRGVLVELPFLSLPLLMLYLGFPFNIGPKVCYLDLSGDTQ